VTQFSAICTVKGGKLKLHDRDGFDRALAQFGDGEDLELFIETVGERRTRAQEKFFHGPICKAFEPLGYHKQEAKDMLALMFIPQEVHQLDGSVVLVPGRTSKLKKDDYTKFIEQCMQLAAEQGLYIEDADEWRSKANAA
jgi:hypothetical protein